MAEDLRETKKGGGTRENTSCRKTCMKVANVGLCHDRPEMEYYNAITCNELLIDSTA